jgi:predicted chitinase
MPRIVNGSTHTENGWLCCNRDECDLVRIPELFLTDTAPLRKGAPLVILGAWLFWYDRNVEEITSPVWGWSESNDVLGVFGKNNGSNHLGGTAVDVNAPRYPWGAYRMPPDKIAKVEEGLRLFEGSVFWGRRWGEPQFHSRPDEMHYQMAWREGDPRNEAFARKLLDGYLGIYKPAPAPPAPTPPVDTGTPPVTEKILPYDRNVVPQETGYWCGPASTQVVLNSRGIIRSEADLAHALGTTTGGTNYVGLIERELDRSVPDANYTSVYIENDPPSQEQKDRLWRDVVQSINAGYGVVMNWVAPPSNYPRGIKGSQSPAYGGGTVYHYVACMGYDPAGERALWIADSGFRPFGYCICFDQAASLIPPKGYVYANTGAPAPPPPPPRPAGPDPVDVLMRAMAPTVVGRDRLAALLPAVSQCLHECDCKTRIRIAMWCSQIGHESAGLRYMEEIASGAAYEWRRDLGNTQPGDGVRFKGRGPIQVTGRDNYTELSQWAHSKGLVPSPTFFVDQPAQLASDRYGFIGVTWYWTTQRPMNALTDARDAATWKAGNRTYLGFEAPTAAINGGINGIDDRRNRYNTAMRLGDELLALVNARNESRDPLEELLMMELESLSPFATPGEPKIPGQVMLQALDAVGHRILVLEDAELGDEDAIFRLVRAARGQGKYTDEASIRRWKVALTKFIRNTAVAAADGDATALGILAHLQDKYPDVLQSFVAARKG